VKVRQGVEEKGRERKKDKYRRSKKKMGRDVCRGREKEVKKIGRDKGKGEKETQRDGKREREKKRE